VIGSFFNTFFYNPLYNGLILLLDVLPWLDLGLAIVVFTILVKLILFPLSQKQIKTQIKIKEIEPKINEIKEKYLDKQERAVKTMELYKSEKINPFAGFLPILIQIPIIFALYFIFLRSGFPEINSEILYSFVKAPLDVNMMFLGLLDVSQKSVILAVLAGISQYFQAKLASPITKKTEKGGLGEDFARSMSIQMRYVFPVMIFFIAYTISAAVAIYWTTSNIFMIGQELYVKRFTVPKNHENNK